MLNRLVVVIPDKHYCCGAQTFVNIFCSSSSLSWTQTYRQAGGQVKKVQEWQPVPPLSKMWLNMMMETHCFPWGSFSCNFSSTFTSSLAASLYLSTFLMIFSANTCRVCTRTTLQGYKVQWRTWSVLSSLTFTTLPKVPSPSVARILSAEQYISNAVSDRVL